MPNAATPCELIESLDHSRIENWKDLTINAGPEHMTTGKSLIFERKSSVNGASTKSD